MKRKIVAFHQDEHEDWVADLECGHQQHLRHNPPWATRPWVLTPEGRQEKMGAELTCSDCKEQTSPDFNPGLGDGLTPPGSRGTMKTV